MKSLFPILTKALLQVEEGASAQLILDEYRQRVPEDSWGLFQTFYLGVLEWQSHLESILKEFSKLKLNKYPKEDRYLMLLALYGILFLRKPPYAIVNETVELFKRKKSRLAPMANAILRSVLREEDLDQRVYGRMTPKQKMIKKYGYPVSTTSTLLEQLGDKKAEELLLYSKSIPRTDFVILGEEEEVLRMLEEEGHEIKPLEVERGYSFVKMNRPLEKVKAFKEGKIYIQSNASQVLASLIPEGKTLLDLCAAPGGKSIALLARDPNREITGADLTKDKLRMIRENLDRLALDLDLKQWDATEENPAWLEAYDTVLLDAPCSGTGVLHRQKGESADKELYDLEQLTLQQDEMLTHAAKYVKNGGFLIYSTCSILRDENEKRVEEFLQKHPNFTVVNLSQDEAFYRSYPEEGEDGFFACLMEKNEG